MREVKYRGRTNGGKWVYGFFAGQDYFDHNKAYIKIHSLADKSRSVEYNTLGQYTGLRDVKSKGIYEGDILCCVDDRDGAEDIYYEVVFTKGCFCVDNYDNRIFECHTLWSELQAHKCTIVGNKYDNRELLKH